MSDLISVVVPHFCTPKDLFSRCIGSLLASKAPNIEVLVIDDGSPNEYQMQLRQICEDSRVRVIYAPHAGVSCARNRGIREANGEWITFVDSDDYVEKETFDRIANNINSMDGDVVIFNGGADRNGVIKNNTLFLHENVNYGKNRATKYPIMESALSAGLLPKGYVQYFSLGAPYCKLFKKAFLSNNGLYFDADVKFAEDVLFLLHIYEKAATITYHNWFLYYYVNNGESVTRKYRPGLSKDMDVFFSRVTDFLKENELEEILERSFYLRVQFEVRRSIILEFFNLQNHNRGQKRSYKEFISKEPYKTALIKNYYPHNNIKGKIFWFLARNGLGYTYKFLKRLKASYIRYARN